MVIHSLLLALVAAMPLWGNLTEEGANGVGGVQAMDTAAVSVQGGDQRILRRLTCFGETRAGSARQGGGSAGFAGQGGTGRSPPERLAAALEGASSRDRAGSPQGAPSQRTDQGDSGWQEYDYDKARSQARGPSSGALVVIAYGIIWLILLIYVLLLARRQRRLRLELEALRELVTLAGPSAPGASAMAPLAPATDPGPAADGNGSSARGDSGRGDSGRGDSGRGDSGRGDDGRGDDGP